MDNSNKNAIKNIYELEFAIFCIENVAERLRTDPLKVFHALAENSDILYNYIIPYYDVLHTQDKEYIVNDILDTMKDKGVTLWLYIMVLF